MPEEEVDDNLFKTGPEWTPLAEIKDKLVEPELEQKYDYKSDSDDEGILDIEDEGSVKKEVPHSYVSKQYFNNPSSTKKSQHMRSPSTETQTIRPFPRPGGWNEKKNKLETEI